MGEEETFKFTDKRRFKEDSEESPDKSSESTHENSHEKTKEEPGKVLKEELGEESTRDEKKPAEDQPSQPRVEVTLTSFIFSLASSAFIHLGEEPDPVTGGKRVSLPLAKETIDIVALLEDKTKGNLTSDEEQLIKNILYALRMKYVEMASKRPNDKV